MMEILCPLCRKNTVHDCDGQRRVDSRDGRIMCFDCRSREMGIRKEEPAIDLPHRKGNLRIWGA